MRSSPRGPEAEGHPGWNSHLSENGWPGSTYGGRMHLTDGEKAMLDGGLGPAKQKAMDLLMRYGVALGAERLVETNNVVTTLCAFRACHPEKQDFPGFDALVSEDNLDSAEVVEIPPAEVFTCQLETIWDADRWQRLGVSPERYELYVANMEWCGDHGVQLTNTCMPFLSGNVPTKGQHCAWMESAAVIYINSVLGARSNVEGQESSCAAMLTGRTPYWGYHITENRYGTCLVYVEWDVQSDLDWGLLGYYVGGEVGEHVPVIDGIHHVPNLDRLQQFGAAAASSGGVEMFHIPGITAEANSVADALHGKKPAITLKFGSRERSSIYDRLNTTAGDANVDLVVVGCPHASLEQIWEVCRLVEGRKLKAGLWIQTPPALKSVSDRSGSTRIIEEAGGEVRDGTCICIEGGPPQGMRVVATNAAKTAHYLPAIAETQVWYGSLGDCIDAAITGQWSGEL